MPLLLFSAGQALPLPLGLRGPSQADQQISALGTQKAEERPHAKNDNLVPNFCDNLTVLT